MRPFKLNFTDRHYLSTDGNYERAVYPKGSFKFLVLQQLCYADDETFYEYTW